jgi:anti-sigma factor RsiW
MKCEESSRLLSPYLDSELDPKTSFDMSSHFEQCASCRERFEAERRIDHAIAIELRKPDPRDEEHWNRARALALRPSGHGGLWALLILGAIIAATAFAALRPHAAIGLAQELRSVYLALEANRSTLDLATANPNAVETFCRDQLGLAIRVPAAAGSFTLEGARKCSLRGAGAAALSYRDGEHRILVVVFNADHLDRFPASDRVRELSLDEAGDPRVAVMRSGWKVIGAAGSASPDELGAACKAFQD